MNILFALAAAVVAGLRLVDRYEIITERLTEPRVE